VIVTKPQSKQEKKLQTTSETWQPVIVAQEGAGGSKSVAGAQSLARAQQACGDAVYRYLGAIPIMPTVQAVKKKAIGRVNSDKDEVEAAMRARWPLSDFDALLTESPVYLEQGQRPAPPGLWENAFDAAAVAHCVWDEPAVAMARRMAA